LQRVPSRLPPTVRRFVVGSTPARGARARLCRGSGLFFAGAMISAEGGSGESRATADAPLRPIADSWPFRPIGLFSNRELKMSKGAHRRMETLRPPSPSGAGTSSVRRLETLPLLSRGPDPLPGKLPADLPRELVQVSPLLNL